MVLMLQLAVAAAGCRDQESPTAPAFDDVPTASAVGASLVPQGGVATTAQVGPATAAVAIEDALSRVLPALRAGGSTTELATGLQQLCTLLEEDGGGSSGLELALTAVQNAVDRYQARADAEFQPDISVLRLALDAVTTG